MNSRKAAFAVTALAVVLAAPACAPDAPAPAARLNVLLVTIDTLRADRLGCYGGTAVPTPNIDRLAGQGTIFTRAFAHTPLTLPSHASILLGTTPVAHGVHDNIDFVVRPEHVTLAEHLKAIGYRTAAFVSASPLDSRFGLAQGFDVYDDSFMAPGTPKTSPAEQPAETTVDKAMSWLVSVESEPWFLWIHLWDPHADYAPPEPFGSRYQDRPYDGEVAYTDFALGRLFGALEESRTSERTLVVLTADHGEGLGDHGERTHGYLAYNSTIWVPLIIAAPGLGAFRSASPVAHSDIVPTVFDVLGVAAPAGLQGLSARRALSGKSLPSRKIYFECLSPYYELGWAPLRGYIAGADKFVESPIPELYDLAADFAETKNLAPAAGLDGFGRTLKRLIADLGPAAPLDSGARTDTDLKEKLESLGYVGRAGRGLKTSFSADDDVKTLLPLYDRITDAYALASRGERDEAIRRLEAIVLEAKTLDTAYVHLADLHAEAGERGRALEVLTAGWRRFPSSYELLSSYVAALVSDEKWEDIVRAVDEAKGLLQMDHDGTVWFFQGLAYQRLGKGAGAAAALEKALAADGEYLAALFNLGAVYLNLYFETGDAVYCARAVPLLERATGLDPGNPEVFTLLGRAYIESGQADKAIASLETARSLAPDLANVEFQLGLAFLAKRDFVRAQAHLASFKDRVYRTLSPEEKANLDGLIRKVQDAGR